MLHAFAFCWRVAMSAGRTSWFPRDAAKHRRELIVELGEEFGPLALAVTDVLEATAWESRRGGRVKGTFADVAEATFMRDVSQTRAVIERAATLGVDGIREYETDGERFTLTVGAVRTMRARRQRTRPALPRGVEQRIAFYGGLCWICRAAPWEHVDHVKPLAAGGSNLLANLRPACGPCNTRKGARWPLGVRGG